ncbi:uncharacterized protein LOC110225423 isoform X4 [Arabidopsis lyrata subsp. lyrata]|uniref:uncharacterized protein LOC110225423 isoform X4 n=1 Tax=Arabidopsis lyrata subsp. lyrata TaxID=81972 RepID=UPI000A29E771|nr:uncharacterized protein LOC110225423 isoform X4 [Arabidopsis lyrata subsp. lyrata]|eukprot:XP_020870819.1 uncharacterized protein LOC110225423 isoform X4 [Arabidopsis lyrata subsp. lyrata]
MENETAVPIDPDSPLFLSGDGFEPAGILFPHAVFHFPSREKKEAYDFMDKANTRGSYCSSGKESEGFGKRPFPMGVEEL